MVTVSPSLRPAVLLAAMQERNPMNVTCPICNNPAEWIGCASCGDDIGTLACSYCGATMPGVSLADLRATAPASREPQPEAEPE